MTKKKKEILNNNYPRPLIIGKYAPKLILRENLHLFSVPLRCRLSTLSSLGPESISFKCKLQGGDSCQKLKK